MCYIEDTLIEQLPKLKSLALLFTKNNQDADDLVNDTCLHILQRKHLFKENKNISGWFSIILKNLFINQYRRKQNSPIDRIDFDQYQLKTLFSSEESDSEIIYKELQNILDKDSLNYNCFIAFVNGYKYDQIAEMFELPISTVKSRIHIFKNKLKYVITGKPNKYYNPKKKNKVVPISI